jgi:hypothetical protein
MHVKRNVPKPPVPPPAPGRQIFFAHLHIIHTTPFNTNNSISNLLFRVQMSTVRAIFFISYPLHTYRIMHVC